MNTWGKFCFAYILCYQMPNHCRFGWHKMECTGEIKDATLEGGGEMKEIKKLGHS